MASTIAAGTSAGTAIAISGDTSGSLVLQTNGTTTAVTLDTSQNATFAGKVTSAGALTLASNGTTTAVTIDTSQNVGIGTSSPTVKLQVIGTTISSNFYNGTGTASAGTFGADSAGTGASIVMYGSTGANPGAMIISAGSSERIRINSSGYVGINNTSPSRRLVVTSGAATKLGGANGALFTDSTNDGGILIGSDFTFANIQGCNAAGTSAKNLTINPEGGECYVGGATDNGAYNLQCIGTGVWGAGAYVNGSDERIKEDITPIESSLDVVKKLNPVTYRYKESWSKDQSIQTGFIAQELLVALEGKNYVNGIVQQGGSEGYYSVAYQNIIPILTKAIQEQQALIIQLQADVAALKGVK